MKLEGNVVIASGDCQLSHCRVIGYLEREGVMGGGGQRGEVGIIGQNGMTIKRKRKRKQKRNKKVLVEGGKGVTIVLFMCKFKSNGHL